MLENPKSIQVLIQIKEYYTDLKLSIEDADLWLNKINDLSKKQKIKVINIFTFFSQICTKNSAAVKDIEQEKEEEHTCMHTENKKKDDQKAIDEEWYNEMLKNNKRISTKDFLLF